MCIIGKKPLQNPKFVGIDEHGLTNALTMTFWDKLSEKLKMPWIAQVFSWRRKQKTKRYYFVEQYTTPFTTIPWLDGSINNDQPEEWFYNKGKVTNLYGRLLQEHGNKFNESLRIYQRFIVVSDYLKNKVLFENNGHA